MDFWIAVRASLMAQRLKHLPAMRETGVRSLGPIPGSGRSSGERNGNPLQYPCLENPMDGGAWYATVHGVAKSQTQLSDFTFLSFVMNELWDVLSLNNWGRLGSTMFRVCAQESDGLYLNLVPPLTYPMNSVKSLFLKFFVCKNTLQGCCED